MRCSYGSHADIQMRSGDLGTGGGGRSLSDASGRLPDGAYTTLRTYRRTGVVRLRQHVARLNETAALLGMAGSRLSEVTTRDALRRALADAAFRESRVRLSWAAPALYVSVEEFEPALVQ